MHSIESMVLFREHQITYNYMPQVDSALVKRIKSFLWRLGSYLVVAALAWISDNIGLLELSPMLTTVIALVLGEITKALNTPKPTSHV